MNGYLDYLVGGLRISLNPNSNTPGPKTHILEFLGALDRSGVRTQKFVASEQPLIRGFANLREGSWGDPPTLRLLAADVLHLGANLWAGLCLFCRRIATERPEIIYERVSVFQILYLFHPWRRGAIVVVESNGLMSVETKEDRKALVLEGLAVAMEKSAYRHADYVVAVTSRLAKAVEEFAGVDKNKILVVPNAVPHSLERESVRVRTDTASTPITVGFVGSVIEWQQIDVLLVACSLLPSEIRSRILIEIIGDGPALEDLKALTLDLDLGESVKFTGSLEHQQALERMTSWTIGYSGHRASSHESMYHSPLKLYEYLGLGLGILSTASEDALRIREEAGQVWLFSDSETAAEALTSIVRDYRPLTAEARARTIGNNSWSSRVADLLEEVLG